MGCKSLDESEQDQIYLALGSQVRGRKVEIGFDGTHDKAWQSDPRIWYGSGRDGAVGLETGKLAA